MTYDGSAQTATGTAAGVLGESLSGLNLNGTTHTNAGTYNGDGWTFTDVTGNYANASGTVNDSISQAALTITATANTKTYDGTTTAGATPTVSGLQGSDAVSGLVEAYADANAGTAKRLSITGYTVDDGNSGGNYAVSLVDDTTGVINKATAAINVTGYCVSYNAGPHAATGTAAGVLGESLSGLNLNGTTHTNAGTYDGDGWTFTDVTGNYVDTSGTVNDSIAKAGLTITAVSNIKTYDGTTTAGATPTVVGLAGSDTVTGLVETFDSKNVGAGKTLAVAAVYTVIDGNGGNNYAVTFVTDTTGRITARAITVTAAPNTKTYDGTASASALPTIAFGSLAAGDTPAFSESYDNANVGTGKTLTAAGSVSDGNGGNNYAVTFVADTTGMIISASLTKLMITETSSSTVVSGHDVVYTITLKNLGPGAVQNVVVSDDLAASGLSYVSDPVPNGCTVSAPKPGCTGKVTFNAASFAAGASATFTLVACVSRTAGSNTWVSNQVTVSVSPATPLTGNSVTTASVKAQVNAAGASIVGSSLSTGQTDLVVAGTVKSDSICVLLTCGNRLLVIEDGHLFGPFAAPTGRIVVYSGDGNDMVYVSPLLTESCWIFGGAGNDVFYADSGNSVLVGGSGSNMLVSGRGRNILIGGSGGRSMILGTQGDNVEIGGSTAYDANEAALAAILAEWSSGESCAKRVGCLNGAMTGGLNVLNGTTIDLNGTTIEHGTDCSFLFGGIGQNTYFDRQTGWVLARDYIFGQKSSEQVTPI